MPVSETVKLDIGDPTHSGNHSKTNNENTVDTSLNSPSNTIRRVKNDSKEALKQYRQQSRCNAKAKDDDTFRTWYGRAVQGPKGLTDWANTYVSAWLNINFLFC